MDQQQQQYVRTLVNAIEQLIQQGDIESCDTILNRALNAEWNGALLAFKSIINQTKEQLEAKTSDKVLRDFACYVIDLLNTSTEFLKKPDE